MSFCRITHNIFNIFSVCFTGRIFNDVRVNSVPLSAVMMSDRDGISYVGNFKSKFLLFFRKNFFYSGHIRKHMKG